MNRAQVEHVVKAAGVIANDKKVMIVGSTAIYGSVGFFDCNFSQTKEVDIVFFAKNKEKALAVDGAIGELSQFHNTHDYYGHGIDFKNVVLPSGWQKRLKILYSENMGHVKGYCISAEDLLNSSSVMNSLRSSICKDQQEP